MSQKWLLVLGIVAVAAAALWWYSGHTAPQDASVVSPTASGTTQSLNATTTTPTPQPQQKPTAPPATTPFRLSLAAGDTVVSWNFNGAYTGNADLTQKANTEIARLKNLLGSKEPTDYELYVSIANQYDLLGDGAQEFAYLQKALGVDATHTGLAWANVAQLLSKLGAYRTARTAFEKAIAAQPTLQYHQAFLGFLNAHYPQDSAAIQQEKQIIQSAQTTTTQ